MSVRNSWCVGRWAVVTIAATTPMSLAASWDGSTGNWEQVAHWTGPANVPDTSNETAIITSGYVTMNANYTIGSLVLGGGAKLDGHTNLTTTTLGWTGGVLIDTAFNGPVGTTTVYGNALISLNSTSAVVEKQNLKLYGTTDYYSSGSGHLKLFQNAKLDNNGTLNLNDNAPLDVAQGQVVNHSLFQKIAGTGTSIVQSYTNAGTTIAKTGTLELELADNGTHTGTFTASTGAALRLGGGFGTNTLACSIDGGGTVTLTGGTFAASGTLNSTANKTVLNNALLNGTFNVGAADLNLVNIRENSVVTVNGNATINDGYNFLYSATLNLKGNTLVNGVREAVQQSTNSTINNSGTITISDDTDFNTNWAGTNTFNNTGSLIKTFGNDGVYAQSEVFNLVNTGLVRCDDGLLIVHLKNIGTNVGTFATAAGATMQLDTAAASHTFNTNVVVSGAGTFKFPSQVFTLNGPVRAEGGTFHVADILPGSSEDLIINGAITNGTGPTPTGGFIKDGPGSIRMTGANTYTGATTLKQGRVIATRNAYDTILSNAGVIFAGAYTRMQFDYNGTTDPAGRFGPQLAEAYGTDFQTGLFRKSPTFYDPGKRFGLGYGDDQLLHVATVMCTYYGDADLNGQVNFNDFLALQNNFNQYGRGWTGGDFNYDGRTDFNDFLMLQNNFNAGSATPLTGAEVAALNAFAASVPEPAMLAIPAMSMIALRRRRGA